MKDSTEQKSIAMQVVEILKTQAQRWFFCWLITFVVSVCLVIYIIYMLNDIAVIETTEITQEAETGTNNYIGNDGDISNG